jgi:hypothetical protein
MDLFAGFLRLLRDVLDEVHVLTGTFRFSTTKRQHLIAGALLGRVLEQVEGIYAMLERKDGACGFILLRSLLEAYVDLRNVTKDPGYAEFMHAAFLDQKRRLLEAAIERGGTSTFLVALAGHPEAPSVLDEVRSELAELQARKVVSLQVRQRFELAGEGGMYHGPYADLCWHSHNNINVLERRHLQLVDGSYEIRAFDPITDGDAQLISDTLAGAAANSIVAVGNMLNAGPGLDLDSLTAKVTRFRELWRPNTSAPADS